MLENTNLLRCILKFIHTHFRSQIAIDAIQDSGIVEYLILLLENKEETRFEEIVNLDEASDMGERDQDVASPSQGLYFSSRGDDDVLSRSKWQISVLTDKKYYEIPKTLAECAYVMLERLTSDDELNYQRQDMIDSLEFDTNSKNLLE